MHQRPPSPGSFHVRGSCRVVSHYLFHISCTGQLHFRMRPLGKRLSRLRRVLTTRLADHDKCVVHHVCIDATILQSGTSPDATGLSHSGYGRARGEN
jgi:hypothetical protein